MRAVCGLDVHKIIPLLFIDSQEITTVNIRYN